MHYFLHPLQQLQHPPHLDYQHYHLVAADHLLMALPYSLQHGVLLVLLHREPRLRSQLPVAQLGALAALDC